MATRSSRRKKLSLQDHPSDLQEESALNTTKSSRQIHRHKENDGTDHAGIGKFVKYPHETPVKVFSDNAESKSTRITRKALKEKNVITDETESNALEKTVNGNSNKRGRKTKKSPKNGSMVHNDTKVSDHSDNDHTHNNINKEESVPISTKRNMRTSKRKKAKAKKTSPEYKKLDNVDSVDYSKGLGIYMKPQKHLETSITNTNTSVDSYHSAAGSPASSMCSNNLHSSLNSDKELDISEKNTLNSTVSLSEHVELKKSNSNPDQVSGYNKTPTQLYTEENLLNTTFDKMPERRSSRISLRGKVSEDIFSTSIVLVNSSIDTVQSSVNIDSKIKSESAKSECKLLNETFDKDDPKMMDIINGADVENSKVPHILIREGTFTKESPDFEPKETPGKQYFKELKSPIRMKKSLPAPGSTPYHSRRKTTRSAEKSVSILNLTHSVEEESSLRRSSSIADISRRTKVMFCSPARNPIRDSANKVKIIKSSMKGSNKSFIFDENTSVLKSSRKRSYTHGDVDAISSAKRKKMANDELNNSINRLSRPKTVQSKSKEAKTPNNRPPLRKSLSDTKPTSVRSKLPNFAALHKQAFNKMESLSECQERKAQRSRQMLHFSSGTYTLDGRRSPMVKPPESSSDTLTKLDIKTVNKNANANVANQPEAKFNKESRTYTRFGFKLQTGANTFSIPPTNATKTTLNIPRDEAKGKDIPKNKLNSTISHLPKAKMSNCKLNGAIPAVRREKSKQALITREMSSSKIVEKKKKENRDIIKGVRTNRRFELQMKSRNIK